MDKVDAYKCSYCKHLFAFKTTCLEHEAKIFGLTVDEYSHWLDLQERVKDTSSFMHINHNEKTIKANDKAVEDVLAFEKKHELDDDKISHLVQEHIKQSKYFFQK